MKPARVAILFPADASERMADRSRIVLGGVTLPHAGQHALGLFGGPGFIGTLHWMSGTLGFPGALAADDPPRIRAGGDETLGFSLESGSDKSIILGGTELIEIRMRRDCRAKYYGELIYGSCGSPAPALGEPTPTHHRKRQVIALVVQRSGSGSRRGIFAGLPEHAHRPVVQHVDDSPPRWRGQPS